MNITLKRIEAIELLASLRSLDGIKSGDTITAFKFNPEVVDKIVENILTLKPIQSQVSDYQIELMRQFHVDKGTVNPEADDAMDRWIQESVTFDLNPISKIDLNTLVNPIPISIREKLMLLDVRE